MQEKLQNKEKKEADEKKFKFANVDGRTEQVEPFWALCCLSALIPAFMYAKAMVSIACRSPC